LNYYGAWGIPLTGGVSLMIPGTTLLGYLGTWDGLVGSVADKDNPIADEPALF
jgi:hypothetical protein